MVMLPVREESARTPVTGAW